MLVLGHVLVRRLVDDSLATEEFRLAGAHDQHDHHADQDQPKAEEQNKSDPSDTRPAAIIRARTVSQGDDEDEEKSESAEHWKQELEDEVIPVTEELVPEEPDAGERRQAVVEADHD